MFQSKLNRIVIAHATTDKNMTRISRRSMLYLTTASVLNGNAQRTAPKSGRTRASVPNVEDWTRLQKYLRGTVPQLLRPAIGRFAHPSVAPSLPGREYSASLWDWDTPWTCRGILAFAEAHPDVLPLEKVLLHCEGSLKNFFDHASASGRLPILMVDGNTDILGSTSADAPPHVNQAKPIFAQLALLITRKRGKVEWMRTLFEPLMRFYEAWDLHNLHPCGLYVWGDDVAIGNDNDPTTFGRPFFSSANLLLNCLFQSDLADAAELARQLGRTEDAQRLNGKANRLAESIRSLCWDPRDRFFYTADVQCKDHRAELIPQIKAGMPMRWQTLPLRLQTFTGFLPLWCGAATEAQAKQLVETNYLADERLRCASGVRTLSKLETMYSLDFSSNPSNWLGPVWIIANYLVWSGLRRYGYQKEARDLAAKTLHLLASDIERNGSMNEYYHPDTGAALSHKGFMDWNLLILEMLAEDAPHSSAISS